MDKVKEYKGKNAKNKAFPAKRNTLSHPCLRDNWYKAIIQSSPDGFLLIKLPKGNILDFNASFCNMLGYSRDELLSMNIDDLEVGFDEASDTIGKRITDTDETGEACFETMHKCKNGGIINVAVSLKCLDEGLSFCFHRDITKQKIEHERQRNKEQKNLRQKENDLKETEERYRALIELGNKIGEAIITLRDTKDKEGMHIYVSDQWLEITGYSKEELLSMSFFDLVRPEDRQLSIERHRQKMAGKAIPDLFEFTIIRKDGKETPVEITSAVTSYQGGSINVVYIRDITERKMAENKLKQYQQHLEELVEERSNEIIRQMKEYKQTKEQLQFIIDTVPAYINYKDRDLRYQFVNKTIIDKVGIPRQEQLGKKVQEIHPDIPKLCSDETRDDLKVMRTGLPRVQISKYKDSGMGDTWVERSRVPHKGEDGKVKGLVILTKDITKQKKAELKIKSLYEKENLLRHKLETEMKQRTEFTRAIVHEIRTPLTPLMAASEALLNRTSKEPHLSLAKAIYKGSVNLNNRINELFDLTMGEVGLLKLKIKGFQFLDLVSEVVDYMSDYATWHKVDFKADIPKTLPVIQGDRERLRQVLINLLDNAFKYTPKGGEIILKVNKKGNRLFVEVDDTGVGVPKDMQAKIFDPYYRINNGIESYSGLGIGLALSKQIIKLHSGDIWVENLPDKGSAFKFSIPVSYSK